MFDFTLNIYRRLLSTLSDKNYIFQSFKYFLKNPSQNTIILRHDVDAKNSNSLKTALIEYEMGICGTYYFRMVPGSYDEQIIKKINDLGHEIGYHYEDLSSCISRILRLKLWNQGSVEYKKIRSYGSKVANLQEKALFEEKIVDIAINSFRTNREKLRKVAPIETICMHGSPLSKWDNRLLWNYYDYREFGIIGEPYFDIPFNEALYLTDTGRRWDGKDVSIRDKVMSGKSGIGSEAFISGTNFHTTYDIIRAAETRSLPEKIMITIHPQRWTNEALPWLWELAWQNFKNLGKKILVRRNLLTS